MTAVPLNIVLEQEATFRLATTWGALLTVDGVSTVVAPFYDWTGAVARMELRLGPGKPVLLQITNIASANGQLIFGADGLLTIRITDEGTKLLTGKKAEYDVLVTYASGDSDRLLEGDVKIKPAVTRTA